MLLPIRTSIRPYRTPYANYALILINTVIFLLTYWPYAETVTHSGEVLRPWAQHFMLSPLRPYLWQFITYSFLHGGLLHILGNMFFLYIFGNNVNDKLGNFGYCCFYLAGAVFSAIGHTLLSNNPVVGASGAIAAVTGAYLVFFPQTLITIVYWLLYFIGTMEVPALYFILLKMIIIDNVIAAYTPNVAYSAHLSGYVFGIFAALLLLATGLISSSHFDLWAMLRQWDRRRRYRDVVSTGYDPYTGLGGQMQIKSALRKRSPAQRQLDEKTARLREDITARIYRRDLHAAADLFADLMNLDSEQVLPRQQLLDIANQLASENRYQQAAQAYRNFLSHYAGYEHVEQVELMLGLVYSRYLDEPEQALVHLRAAEKRLTDPGQLAMCRDEIVKLEDR